MVIVHGERIVRGEGYTYAHLSKSTNAHNAVFPAHISIRRSLKRQHKRRLMRGLGPESELRSPPEV